MMVDICSWLWRLLIAGVFLLAACSKWQSGINFIPPWSVYDRVVAASPLRHNAIIGFEALVAIWLLSSWRTRYAAVVASLVLTAFIVILAMELWRQSPADCGCGITEVFAGEDPRVGLRIGIVRNALLLLGCGWLFLLGEKASDVDDGAAERQ